MLVFVMEGLPRSWADHGTVQQPPPTNRQLWSNPIAAIGKCPVGGHFRSQAIAVVQAELQHPGPTLIVSATVLLTLVEAVPAALGASGRA